MPLDYQKFGLDSTAFSVAFGATAPQELETAVQDFEDRMWTVAEQTFAARAPSVRTLSEAASLIRRVSEVYTSVYFAAQTLQANDDAVERKASSRCDIHATEDRLLGSLADALSQLALEDDANLRQNHLQR